MQLNRRSFIKSALYGITAFIPAIALGKELIKGAEKFDYISDRVIERTIISHPELKEDIVIDSPIQVFNELNSRFIGVGYSGMEIEVHIENIVCSVGDNISVIKHLHSNNIGYDSFLPFTGRVRRIYSSTSLKSRIFIIKEEYAKRRKAVVNGKLIEVFA